jgi:hypothetical protein
MLVCLVFYITDLENTWSEVKRGVDNLFLKGVGINKLLWYQRRIIKLYCPGGEAYLPKLFVREFLVRISVEIGDGPKGQLSQTYKSFSESASFLRKSFKHSKVYLR